MTWLREWKAAHGHTQAAALSSSANQKNKNAFWLGSSGRGGRGGASYNNDDNYYSDGDSDDEDSGPGNACLLHGPPGVGKTAAVYALAEQLGEDEHTYSCKHLKKKKGCDDKVAIR